MNTEEGSQPVEILLVEDSPGDVGLMQEAFKESKINHRMSVAEDGVEAMAFLYQEGEHIDAPRPDIILLDLNLPIKDGREVLTEIKANENLKTIPVIILTTSNAHEDIIKSYSLGVNCYITKPIDLEEFMTVVKSIESFWFHIAKLPHEERAEAEITELWNDDSRESNGE